MLTPEEIISLATKPYPLNTTDHLNQILMIHQVANLAAINEMLAGIASSLRVIEAALTRR
jgi:hypothetical protein